MKETKIGILTLYYQSNNYGGNLQAYALEKYLLNNGYAAEQICFDIKKQQRSRLKKLFSFGFFEFFPSVFRYIKRICVSPFVKKEEKKHNVLTRRKAAFFPFNQEIILHSEKVYTAENIAESQNAYDVFITGSDQVWNFQWYSSAYFLDFVPSNKIKLSYAASMATDALTDSQKQILKSSLKDFKGVSLRENNAVALIEDLCPVQPQYVLDPTFLLPQDDWNTICAEPQIKDEYIFCYFLGENKKSRRIAERFAREKGLKLVFIPHASGGICLVDKKCKGESLYDVTPQQFLSLIKYAKYVFTDSFHAVVFSNIFQKQYFVFNRNKKGEMNSRIKNITKLFYQEDRFCAGKDRENLQYIQALKEIDYTKENQEFENLKILSIQFLKENLQPVSNGENG